MTTAKELEEQRDELLAVLGHIGLADEMPGRAHYMTKAEMAEAARNAIAKIETNPD